jgi:hypothetical protein
MAWPCHGPISTMGGADYHVMDISVKDQTSAILVRTLTHYSRSPLLDEPSLLQVVAGLQFSRQTLLLD